MNFAKTATMPPVRVTRSETEQIDILISRLQGNHAIDPATIRVVKAPLRICPLGAHIDHQLGLVSGMTINQSILLAFAPTSDRTVHLESLNFAPPLSFDFDDVPPYQAGDWGNYVRGAIMALQRDHQLATGLIGVVGGEMPIGGLSSSAAVTIAYLLALEAVNNLSVPAETNVSLVRFTENEYIGLNNGILDQSVILCSRRNHLTLIDCQKVEIDRVSTQLQTDDFEILVVYSGITRVLVGTDYNNRVAECREAARLLLTYAGQNVGSDPRLRQVEPEVFQAEGHRLPAALRRRAGHYFGEMARVIEGVSAWRSGNLAHFGGLVTESGESSIKYYECGSPQLITLYETLRETPGVYGTRFSGAGFRGSCIALIDPAARNAIAAAVHGRYAATHPEQAGLYSIHCCRPDGQAEIVK